MQSGCQRNDASVHRPFSRSPLAPGITARSGRLPSDLAVCRQRLRCVATQVSGISLPGIGHPVRYVHAYIGNGTAAPGQAGIRLGQEAFRLPASSFVTPTWIYPAAGRTFRDSPSGGVLLLGGMLGGHCCRGVVRILSGAAATIQGSLAHWARLVAPLCCRAPGLSYPPSPSDRCRSVPRQGRLRARLPEQASTRSRGTNSNNRSCPCVIGPPSLQHDWTTYELPIAPETGDATSD